MKQMQNFTIRRTAEREQRIERIRELMKNAGMSVESIHGQPTNAGIIDAALEHFERTLMETERN